MYSFFTINVQEPVGEVEKSAEMKEVVRNRLNCSSTELKSN